MKARDIMSTKVVTVKPDTPVREIATLMVERHISGVPVVDDSEAILGMITEGDLLRRTELGTDKRPKRWLSFFTNPEEQARDFTRSHGLRAEEVMTKSVVFIDEDATLGEVVSKMEKRNVKRLPVMSDGRLVGIVSRVDMLRALAARQAEPVPPPPESDAAIRATLNDVLRHEDWAQSAMVNIIVSDGVVHLWGVIDSDAQRDALRVAAENIPGVTAVEEHLTLSMIT